MDILSDIAVPDVVILANGSPPAGRALALLRDARVLVACDGAAEKAQALGREADFATGDGDSIPPRIRESLGERFVCVKEQESNDLAKAFRFSCKRFPEARSFVILGAHGLREDHLLGNVSRLPDFAEELADASGSANGRFVSMVTDAGRFDVVCGEKKFHTQPGAAFSVFDFSCRAKVVSNGLEWPLEGVSLDALWKGTLNRAVKDTVTVSADIPVVVFRPF